MRYYRRFLKIGDELYMSKNKYFEYLYKNGVEEVKDKKILFCGMVRDSGAEVKHNIPVLEKMASYFVDYRVVIVENNSKDNTKDVLKAWATSNPKVIAICNDFDESKYDAIPKESCYNSPNSRRRIQKYCDYRNIYCDYIVDKLDFDSDYYVEIDLDIARINIKGFITSFGNNLEWNAIIANGYSYSAKLKRRHHDTYCLLEHGKENMPDSLEKIELYREAFEPFKLGMPFVRVGAGMGGMIIWKTRERKHIRYKVIPNNYGGVEVYCDHVCIFKQMKEESHDKFFLNPNLVVYYQSISWKLVKKKFKDTIAKLRS